MTEKKWMGGIGMLYRWTVVHTEQGNRRISSELWRYVGLTASDSERRTEMGAAALAER